MNSFDAAVCGIALVVIVAGFRAGLLRSVATIMGYLAAMPIAVAATPYVARLATDTPAMREATVPGDVGSGLFFVVFIGLGFILGALLRAALDQAVGEEIGPLDRLAGAMLGALRVALVAISLVLVFDRIIPPDRQPAFLAGSQLRPILLAAGQAGLKSLPSEITVLIDQLKSARKI
ncbi:MAG TPA: CvpA family protein [Xanthobacteraceae bacterium]|nr:CvpA family protein [Xanthobacteraceae bacterium]